jgi:hypothetical protein
MSDALERLQKIGAQKIYEDTHIPVNQVQAILYENFDGLTRVQFVGFISILEREYGEDLSALKERGVAAFNERNRDEEAAYTEHVFADRNAKKREIIWIVLFVAALFIFVLFYFTMNRQESPSQESNATVEKAEKQESKQEALLVQKESEVMSEAENTSTQELSDVNLTTMDTVEAKTEELKPVKEKALPQVLKILPKSKVWLGYIDVKTNQKYQKTVKSEFTLNPSKEWLLLFGHGYVTLYVDDMKYSYAKKDTLRLHYKDGKIRQISEKEFKRLNRGRKW